MTETGRTERSEERHQKVEKTARVARILTGAVVVAAIMAVVITIVIQGYQLSKLSKVAVNTQINSDRLVDCTTPGGKCYEQGRSASSGAVGSINKATIAAIWCSGKLGSGATVQQLQLCVKAQLK